MKRLYIICEGQTEQEFSKKILQSYFNHKNIEIKPPLIKKSGGGMVAWQHLKKQINLHLKQDKNAYVTMLIDYYGIQDKHSFPKWSERKKIVDKSKRMDFIEKAMQDEINHHRFIPYIQLHEFEGLLFNNIDAFEDNFEETEYNCKEIQKIIEKHPNPELINDEQETAPSKRLQKNIEGYDKVVYGNCLAESIRLPNIRNKSPRFNGWIKNIETVLL